MIQNRVPSAGGAPSVTRETVLALPTDTGLPALSPPVASTFSCTLKFTVRDCDPDSGVPTEEGYEDEYVVSVACTVTWTPLHR